MYQLQMALGKFKQKRGGGRNFRYVNAKCWYRDAYFFSCSKDMAFDHGGERNR